ADARGKGVGQFVDELGLDENRQGEIVSAVFDSFGIPQPQGLHASDFPSLGALIVFVRMSRPDLVDIKPVRMAQPPEPTKTADEPVGEADALAEPIPVVRCVASPDQLPPLIECFATGITLAGKRIVVMSDRGGASDELTNQLLEHGASVLPLAPTLPVEELKLRLQAWLEDGPVDGVYWLPALDSEPALIHLSRGVWRELNRQKVKNLHGAMRILYESINHKESFLITATRMGGLHGLGYSDVTSPLGGSVTGFAKAFKLEREGGNPKKREKLKTTQLGPVSDADVDGSLRRAGNYNGDSESSSPLVKVVDFEVDSDEWQIAQALIAETLADPETMEVGYVGGQRHGVTLVEVATPNGGPGTPLTEQSVFVITGAARRLTKEIISALSVNGGTFYLLDKAAAPDPDDPRIELLRTDKRALRELLVEEVQKTVPNPTASMIDRLVRFIERENRVLRAIETAEQNGAEAQYHSINMLDDRAVRNFIGEVIRRHGAIDFMVHAAGLKHSRTLLDKDPAEFDLVYDIRADGFYNLLRATDEAPPKCLVVFGTMETMRGSWGQCDSSAADELLRKLTGSLRWQQPETRGLAISWITAGTNGARIDRRRSGTRVGQLIDFSFIRREIESGSYRGEVIYQLNIPS
ncbi:MAG: SDR family oxidoreductase, partial [Candidatus Promineifilaceae bacterium]